MPGAITQAQGALQAEGAKAQGQALSSRHLGCQHQEPGRGEDGLVADGVVGQIGLLAGVQADLVMDPARGQIEPLGRAARSRYRAGLGPSLGA